MAKQDAAKIRPIRKTKTSNRRTLVKNSGDISPKARRGRVIASVGTNYLIRDSSGQIVESYLGGTIITPYKDSTIVAVGDYVWYLEDSYSDVNHDAGAARILKVDLRRSKFSRKTAHYNTKEQVMASNIDNVIIFSSALDPVYNKKLIDRYLVSCEIGEVNPVICVNKIDLVPGDYVNQDLDIYRELGYEVHLLSVSESIGLDSVLESISGEVSLLSGPSGAGKSSFINHVLGGDFQDVGAVSERNGKGQHTTSFSRMFEIGDGGYIIDSPGIRELAVWGIEEGELQLYYHDFDDYSGNCKYPLCSHVHEPGCAVVEAVENNEVDLERYTSYLSFLDTL